MHNVHTRDLAGPATAVAPLLDQIGGSGDRIWPSPAWPPIRLNGPLRAGTSGGHATIRYTVEAHEPGQAVRFRFDSGVGIDGFHELRLEAIDARRCRLTHVLEGRTRGRMRLAWPLVVRWIHDALTEDLLDRAELTASGTLARPARWHPPVRLLHRLTSPRVRAVPVPPITSAAAGSDFDHADLADAYAVRLRPGMTEDPAEWARATFRDPPGWVVAALMLRNAVVGLIGIERGDRSAFDTIETHENWLVLGGDARHLNFRVCIVVAGGTVTAATFARVRNTRGQIYLAAVRLAHPVIVRSMLRRAAWELRLKAEPPRADRAAGGGGSQAASGS